MPSFLTFATTEVKIKLLSLFFLFSWLGPRVNTLIVQCEPENVVDKHAVCLKNDNEKENVVVLLMTILDYLRSHPERKTTAKVTGKKINLREGEDLKVPWILHITGRIDFMSILIEQFDLLKGK